MDLTVDAPALIDKKIELNLDEYYNITDKIIYLVVNGKYDSKQIFDKGVTVWHVNNIGTYGENPIV